MSACTEKAIIRRLGCVVTALGNPSNSNNGSLCHRSRSGSVSGATTTSTNSHRLKICIGRLWQESNDFSPVLSTREMFENDNPFFRGEEIPQPGHGAELGGIVDALMEWPEATQLVGLASMQCFPNGRVNASCYAWLRDEILEPLEAVVADGGVDAVIVSLHGAMVAEGEDDPEGALLGSIRSLIGPDIPLVISLDLHCHLTPTILEQVDALCMYHTNPHQDLYETGKRAAGMLRRILLGGVTAPSIVSAKLPMLIPNERMNMQATSEDIASGASSAASPILAQRLRQLEQKSWCLSAGVSFTQPWLDVEDLGCTVVLTTDGTAQAEKAAIQATSELATWFWEQKESFLPLENPDGSGSLTSLIGHQESLLLAHAHVSETSSISTPSGQRSDELRMCVIGDGGNATSAGAPGDSGHLLHSMLQHTWPRPAAVAYVAPAVVAAAFRVGEKGVLPTGTTAGAEYDTQFGVKVPIGGAVVKKLFRAKFSIANPLHFMGGLAFDMGDAATIDCGGNVLLVATAASGALFATELFQLAGVDPLKREASLIIANSVNGFRATYGASASLILNCEAPGCAPPRFYLQEYVTAYTKLGRPEKRLFPWDGRESDGGDGISSPITLDLKVAVKRRAAEPAVASIAEAVAEEEA